MANNILLGLVLALLVYAAAGEKNPTGSYTTAAEQCRLRRLRTVEPSRRLVSEGGVTELWDTNEDEFQCAGVAAIRNTVQPNSQSQPNYQPAPMLVYIEQGEGLLGITIPGCAETYESESFEDLKRRRASRQGSLRGEQGEQQGEGRRTDQHQRVHRIRRGDILAIPAGATHWCYNDGNQELVAFAVIDINNQANQLDQQYRSFLLAGGEPNRQGQGQGQRQHEQQRNSQNFQNIFSGFNTELLAEAYNIPVEIVRRMQENDERGLLVKCQEEMRHIIRADEDEEDEEDEAQRQRRLNGLEETVCTTRLRHNMDTRSESDIVSRQAGRVNIVNQHKLPILRFLDMSAEKGHLFPNALYSPNWAMNNHRVIYVTRGDAHVQIADDNGNNVFDERVNRGDVLVIPQFFAAMTRAGSNGFEYVSIKTAGQPMKSTLAGYTSVIRAMPADVLANSFQISPDEAQQLKHNRGRQSLVLSSSRISP